MELINFYLLYVLFAYALELMDESQNDNNIYDQKRTNIASGHARYFSYCKTNGAQSTIIFGLLASE